MQTGVILAIALIPVYILLFSLVVNVFLYKTQAAFKTAFISPSHRIPATIRFLLPYPISAYGLTKATAARDGPNSGASSARGGNRETRQRAELQPVTLPPLTTTSSNHNGSGGRSSARGIGGSSARTTPSAPTTSNRVITRGGRRWGRTGSQRSTQTLPLYSEDVGDEDVVLIAKRDSMRSMQSARSRRDRDVEDIEEEGETTENDFREELDRDVSQGAEHDVDSQSSAQSPSASGARTSPSNRRDRSASIISSTSIQERGWGEAPTYEDAVRHTPQLGSSLHMSEDMHRGSQDTSMAADISRVQTSDSAQIPLTASARDSTTTGTAGGFRSFVSRLTGRVPVSSGTAGRYTGVHPSPGDAENGQGVGWGEAEGPSEAYAMTGRPRGFSSASGQSQLTVDTAAPRPSISSGMQRFRSNTGASTNNSLVSLLLHPTMSNQSDANAASSARFHFRSRSASNALSLPPDPSSPSASVVNLGISPPLPGSVIRSAYIPPRAGFSTEQLKFLSSTESLGKYGASFGPNEAAMGFGPSSEAYTTRSRSGSASSTGPMDRNYNLHTRGQSIGSATYMGDMSTGGLPTFDELLREEAAADEIRRGSGIQAGNTVHPEEEAVVQETPTVVEIPAQSSPSPVVAQTELQPPTQLPTLSISRISPSFDLEVVPPTPMIEESRRSLIIEP